MDQQEVVRESLLWEQALAIASLLLVALITFFLARGLGRLLRGSTRLGLHGLERLAAPITLIVTLLAAWLILLRTPRDPPIVQLAIEFVAIASRTSGSRATRTASTSRLPPGCGEERIGVLHRASCFS